MCLTGMVNLKNAYFTHDELKEALKKFKAQRDDVQHPLVNIILFKFDFVLFLCIVCDSVTQYLRCVPKKTSPTFSTVS